jgi:hypothetical protein
MPVWVGALVVCLFSATAHAQQYNIPWFKIAGGGGMQSTGGVFALSGTIGQPDAGRVAHTNAFRIEGGFWAIAVQQAGFPTLNILPDGTNAIVSWVTAETGFVLQTTANLAAPTAWADAGLAPTVNGTTNAVVVPLNPVTRSFFRLRRP